MKFTVKLFPQDDGGAVITTRRGFLRLDIAELSQLRSLLEIERPDRLGFTMPTVTNVSVPDAPAVASIGLWVMVGTVNGVRVTVLRAPGTPLLPLTAADVNTLIAALTASQAADKTEGER